jgi:hypothetical protein
MTISVSCHFLLPVSINQLDVLGYSLFFTLPDFPDDTRQTFYRQMVLYRLIFFGHSTNTLPSIKKTLGKEKYSAN